MLRDSTSVYLKQEDSQKQREQWLPGARRGDEGLLINACKVSARQGDEVLGVRCPALHLHLPILHCAPRHMLRE